MKEGTYKVNTKINIDKLADWIRDLIEAAKDDQSFSITCYEETENAPFNIIGGWVEGFSEDYNDILYISKSNPACAMCVMIAANERPYTDTNFEICIALDHDEDVNAMAQFYAGEWETLTRECEED